MNNNSAHSFRLAERSTSEETVIDYSAFELEAFEALMSGKPLTGKDGIVIPLIKRMLEFALECEIEAQLTKHDAPNLRNNKSETTIRSSHSPIDLSAPRECE